jgi:hypothetical protein
VESVAANARAPAKKGVYRGLSALAALCVGDIGDVISIYEMILSRAGRAEVIPVDSQAQSAAFQEYCSRRLYCIRRIRPIRASTTSGSPSQIETARSW